jgi:hypothetical protein
MSLQFSPEDIAHFQAFLNQLMTTNPLVTSTPLSLAAPPSQSLPTTASLAIPAVTSLATTSSATGASQPLPSRPLALLNGDSSYYPTLSIPVTTARSSCSTISWSASSLSSLYWNPTELAKHKCRESSPTCFSQQFYSLSGCTPSTRSSSYSGHPPPSCSASCFKSYNCPVLYL